MNDPWDDNVSWLENYLRKIKPQWFNMFQYFEEINDFIKSNEQFENFYGGMRDFSQENENKLYDNRDVNKYNEKVVDGLCIIHYIPPNEINTMEVLPSLIKPEPDIFIFIRLNLIKFLNNELTICEIKKILGYYNEHKDSSMDIILRENEKKESMMDNSKCIICFENDKEICFTKCGHICTCKKCTESIDNIKVRKRISGSNNYKYQNKYRCPFCRIYSNTIKVFIV